ncbi:tripartite motif-containing protein 16-like protein [Salarias fasciatus]|uniref:tripartite motif-containing protein 16-like protein n=1 Tax=Salarias fasciatus TaxID=181472 RepID=UPI001176BC71|nr:tripartite motif-containing protein 16-like protein [Salarias fasciatus]XP_029938575.1 tripartite motif-containing protein 16-like protein [Salarias fasciatus]
MAQRGSQLDPLKFFCSICLDLLKDPVAVPCGHSYCSNCIKSHWDEEKNKGIYSCPQCREEFRQRPNLKKNILLAELVEDLKKTGPQDAAAERRQRQMKLERSQLNIKKRIQERQKEVKLLQQQVEAINVSADEAVENSEESFTQMIRLIQKRSLEVKQHLRSHQQKVVSELKELEEKLEQEISELKRKDVQLEQLAHTEDHTQFLLSYPSVSALSEPTHSSSIQTAPLRYFEDVAAAVSESREKLQDILRDTGTNISLRAAEEELLLLQPQQPPKPQPESRADFLQYSQQITLDPTSANRRLLLSDGNRKVTVRWKNQPYSDHPDRFTGYFQVLSRESLTGRCYWEVEWRGRRGVYVAVTYKNISRAGKGKESLIGFNDNSWALCCDTNSFIFRHDNTPTPVSGPQSSRVGVYLDHTAGILSFYSISETMTLLHRVQATFTQPLHAGVTFFFEGAFAEFVNPH